MDQHWLITDYRAGTSERCDKNSSEKQSEQSQVFWLVVSDEVLLWPKEFGRVAAAVHSDGQR